MSQLGCIDGKTINLEHRFVGERYDRVDALAAELVESGVDILVVDATANAMAAKRATKTIPIIFVFVGDPVGLKLVDKRVMWPGRARLPGAGQVDSEILRGMTSASSISALSKWGASEANALGGRR